MQPEPIVMDGPALVFGGPYSNLQATGAVLAEARRLGVPPGRAVCTGDVVAYCGDALATAELVRRSGIHVVMGNCEESLGNEAAECGCGFEAGTACARLAVEWYRHANRALDGASRAWMRGLPRRIDIVIAGRTLAAIHGGVAKINRYIFASTPEAEKRAEISAAGCDGMIGGHCGLPFTQIDGGKLWHNPGAIGLPANDGTPRVWYSLLTPTREGLRIEHRALDYPHRDAARTMRAAGLPEGYAAALSSGIWPSCDVLPAEERRAQGQPIMPGIVTW